MNIGKITRPVGYERCKALAVEQSVVEVEDVLGFARILLVNGGKKRFQLLFCPVFILTQLGKVPILLRNDEPLPLQ